MALYRSIFTAFVAALLFSQASLYAHSFTDDAQTEMPKSFSDFVVCQGVTNEKTEIGVSFTLALAAEARLENGTQEVYGLVRKSVVEKQQVNPFAWTELVKLVLTQDDNSNSVVTSWHLIEAFEPAEDRLEIDLASETGTYTTQFPRKKTFDLNCDYILSPKEE